MELKKFLVERAEWGKVTLRYIWKGYEKLAIPQFSIIIITRNGVISFKKEAIMSVLMQDFEDYEVVVYNNASEKSATKYVRELQFF